MPLDEIPGQTAVLPVSDPEAIVWDHDPCCGETGV